MGLLAEPGEGTTNCSLQVQPSLNSTEEPGLKVDELTLAMVSQALEGLVPLLESLPMMPQLST